MTRNRACTGPATRRRGIGRCRPYGDSRDADGDAADARVRRAAALAFTGHGFPDCAPPSESEPSSTPARRLRLRLRDAAQRPSTSASAGMARGSCRTPAKRVHTVARACSLLCTVLVSIMDSCAEAMQTPPLKVCFERR